MECKNEYFRHILLFYFRTGKSTSQATKKLRDVYGEEASKDRQCRNWFDKFRSGDFSLKDEQRLGRSNEVDDWWLVNKSDLCAHGMRYVIFRVVLWFE